MSGSNDGPSLAQVVRTLYEREDHEALFALVKQSRDAFAILLDCLGSAAEPVPRTEPLHAACFEQALAPQFLLDRDGVLLDRNHAARSLGGAGADALAVALGDAAAAGLRDGGDPATTTWTVATEVAGMSWLAVAARLGDRAGHVLVQLAGSGPAPADAAQLAALLRHEIGSARDDMARVQCAARAKSEFLASMSHEIRTPIHNILGFARLIADDLADMPPEQVRRFLGRVLESGERLLYFVNDLLDLSKLEAGRMRLEPSIQDLVEVVERVALEFAPTLAGKRVELELELPDTPARLALDPERIGQVVRNLVANARRFAPDGSVVEIVLAADPAQGGWRVEVRDRGPGIPADELESIFERYVQSSLNDASSGGTGLGLPIARGLAELHGGSLAAANRDGGGAVFSLHLPVTGSPV